MELDRKEDAAVQFLSEARNRYAPAVVNGLLARVRSGRKLFYGTEEILASSGYNLEDAEILKLALADPTSDDHRADAASSVLGPKAAGQMIDALLGLASRAQTDRATGEPLSRLQRRLEQARRDDLEAAARCGSLIELVGGRLVAPAAA